MSYLKKRDQNVQAKSSYAKLSVAKSFDGQIVRAPNKTHIFRWVASESQDKYNIP